MTTEVMQPTIRDEYAPIYEAIRCTTALLEFTGNLNTPSASRKVDVDSSFTGSPSASGGHFCR